MFFGFGWQPEAESSSLPGDVCRKLQHGGRGLGWTAAHRAQDAAGREISRVDTEKHGGNDGQENGYAEDQTVQSGRTHQLGIHFPCPPYMMSNRRGQLFISAELAYSASGSETHKVSLVHVLPLPRLSAITRTAARLRR